VAHAAPPADLPPLPRGAVDRMAAPVRRFLEIEAASGIVLIVCTLVALALANSPARGAWQAFWDLPLTVGVGDFALSYPLWYWVNDGLMAIFFFVIGLEIKRELALGELSEPRKVALPVAAAVGGALVPALIFTALRHGTPDARGWAVPMATDIAFVVGCLALLGPRVPHGLKILLLTLAIVDDLLAVIVIAAFYSGALDLAWLAGAAGGLALIVALNRGGVRRVGIYVLAGTFVWWCTLKSGIHPTVAGAALGLLTPWRAWVDDALSRDVLTRAAGAIQDAEAPLAPAQRRALLTGVAAAAREALSPLDRLQHALHGWVGFAIMPVFALANAGVALGEGSALAPLPLAIALGLVLGKPLGILAASWLVTRGGARLPEGVTWRVMLGAGCLAGIGFTMSLFVASLSFDGAALASAKTGVLLGSLVASLLGLVLLRVALPRRLARPS
jgi:Na+:H+ antiporter, NhaA family